MAATFAQLAQIANSSQFQQRVALNSAAAAVYNEGSGVTSHAARAGYAIKVANGSFNLQAASMAVITSATIAAEVTNTADLQGLNIVDGDIQNSVNSLWNLLAGV